MCEPQAFEVIVRRRFRAYVPEPPVDRAGFRSAEHGLPAVAIALVLVGSQQFEQQLATPLQIDVRCPQPVVPLAVLLVAGVVRRFQQARHFVHFRVGVGSAFQIKKNVPRTSAAVCPGTAKRYERVARRNDNVRNNIVSCARTTALKKFSRKKNGLRAYYIRATRQVRTGHGMDAMRKCDKCVWIVVALLALRIIT